MALYGAFSRHRHFDEMEDVLVTNSGVLSPTARRALARANLGIGTDAQTLSAVQTFTAVPVGTITLAGVAGPYDSLTWNTTASGVASKHSGANFVTTTAVALGDWANAMNGKIDFGTTGRVTGLGGAICAELDLGAGCTEGSYACFEAEMILPAAGSLTGTRSSFHTMNVSGHATGVGRFDTNGFLFDVNGLSAGASNLFRTGLTAATINAATTAALRIQIGGVTYSIPIATATA